MLGAVTKGRGLLTSFVLALLLMALLLAPAVRASTPPVSFADGDGIHLVSVKQLDARQWDISVVPAALGRAVDVRVLLPSGYSQHPATRFPTLYLFHGTSGRASDWVTMGDAEATTANLPLIVVMPDAGFDGDGGGWFTNWWDQGTVLGPSQWETFHIDELVPWIDHNLRTIANRDGRAVAGLSQGGFGSTTYAARHPDMFVSVASFSGAPDIDYNPAVGAGAAVIITGTAVGLDGVEPWAMFGPKVGDEINWQGHDPATLAANLRWTDIWLWTGDGVPGPYDNPPNPEAMAIEGAVHASTVSFWQRLQSLGIPSHFDDYVDGTHSWPYWARDLSEYVGPLMQTFAHPPAAPSSVYYESIDRTWSQWGWTVSWQRQQAQAWSSIDDADAGGFILSGAGTASVTTPAFYPPGSSETVTVAGMSSRVVADQDGRLRLTVPVGGSGLFGVTPGSVQVRVSRG